MGEEEKRSTGTTVRSPAGYIFLSRVPSFLSLSPVVHGAARVFCWLVYRAPRKQNILRPFAATECRRHYSPSGLPSLSLLSLLFVFFYISSSSSSTSPSPFTHSPLLLLLLLLLLLQLLAPLLLLLISAVSTSQGPFSRRSLLLTGRVATRFPLSPGITIVSRLLRGPDVSLVVIPSQRKR